MSRAHDRGACTTDRPPGITRGFLLLGCALSCTAEPVPELPDLVVDSTALARDVQMEWAHFADSDCAVDEGCVLAAGDRRLLRFTTEIVNQGNADLLIGDPSEDESRFEYSECHGHHHFKGFILQELVNEATGARAQGNKLSFCLQDSTRVVDLPGVDTVPLYSCSGTQGIQAGWSDMYPWPLDCQFVDITDLPAARYTLRVTVNTDRTLEELAYDNNVTEVEVAVPDPAQQLTAPCEAVGPRRDCGWDLPHGSRACTPGTELWVACAGACPDEPRCSGDPMLRACAGEGPCPAVAALAMDDDGCAGHCPVVTFDCPASGAYTVMVASRYPGEPYTCDLSELPR